MSSAISLFNECKSNLLVQNQHDLNDMQGKIFFIISQCTYMYLVMCAWITMFCWGYLSYLITYILFFIITFHIILFQSTAGHSLRLCVNIMCLQAQLHKRHRRGSTGYKQWTTFIWASLWQNLSSRFLIKRDSTLSPQLQRLARKLKFCLSKYDIFQYDKNKGADQTAWMYRLVCAFVVRKPRRQFFFLRLGPYLGSLGKIIYLLSSLNSENTFCPYIFVHWNFQLKFGFSIVHIEGSQVMLSKLYPTFADL